MPSKFYKVVVTYPNFSEDGEPYFDDTCVKEELTLTMDDLKKHKWQEEKGFLKIISIQPIIPRA